MLLRHYVCSCCVLIGTLVQHVTGHRETPPPSPLTFVSTGSDILCRQIRVLALERFPVPLQQLDSLSVVQCWTARVQFSDPLHDTMSVGIFLPVNDNLQNGEKSEIVYTIITVCPKEIL